MDLKTVAHDTAMIHYTLLEKYVTGMDAGGVSTEPRPDLTAIIHEALLCVTVTKDAEIRTLKAHVQALESYREDIQSALGAHTGLQQAEEQHSGSDGGI